MDNQNQSDGKTADSKLPVIFRALKHRNFQLFFGGQFISLIGTWMQSVAQSWLVYKITGSVALGGIVCIGGSILFGWNLPKLRVEAREIIVSLQMTGGEPASKASFQQPPLASTAK